MYKRYVAAVRRRRDLVTTVRYIAIAAALFVVPSALSGQRVPREEFLAWARTHAHPVQLSGTGASARDLEPLRAIAGNARILAFGEPMHVGHEVLTMRNRMIQYAVTALGARAVALETGLAASRRLYDHVLGKTTESDSVLASSFSYGFGDHPQNLELVRWLRSYKASADSSRVVRLYGIDLTGVWHASAAPALRQVFEYLEVVDPGRAKAVRANFANVTDDLNARRYSQLERPRQDAIVARVQGVVALLRRQRPAYIAATSWDDYEWALQSAITTAQDVAGFRAVPPSLLQQIERGGVAAVEPGPQWLDMVAMREVAMLENVSWIMDREAARGRVFLFAHIGHLQKHVHQSNEVKQADGIVPFGEYARSRFGADYLVVGTYFGSAEGFPEGLRPAAPDSTGIDGLLASSGVASFIADLRQLPRGTLLVDWFAQAHRTRSGNFGELIELIRPSSAFDAILYIDRVTPVAPLRNARR
jgi:erythromycin esterase